MEIRILGRLVQERTTSQLSSMGLQLTRADPDIVPTYEDSSPSKSSQAVDIAKSPVSLGIITILIDQFTTIFSTYGLALVAWCAAISVLFQEYKVLLDLAVYTYLNILHSTKCAHLPYTARQADRRGNEE